MAIERDGNDVAHDDRTPGAGAAPDDSIVLVQTPSSRAQEAALATLTGLREQIDPRTVPSGVLLENPGEADALDAFDGSEGSPVAHPFQVSHAWDLVQKSRVATPIAGSAPDVDLDVLGQQAEGNTVPIVVAELAYERARPRWTAALQGEGTPELSGLIRAGRAFIAGALLPPRPDLFSLLPGCHHGLDVELTFAGHLKNAAPPAPTHDSAASTPEALAAAPAAPADSTSYSLDPGDGQARPFSAAQPLRHRYTEPGVKTLTLRAVDAAGHERVARFALQVAPVAPAPSAVWSTGPGEKDRAYVYYGRPNGQTRTRLEQPVLISDGFPGGRDVDDLWPLVNQSRFVDSLLDAGKDVILIGYDDGKKAIGESAKQYIEVVRRAIRERAGDAPLASGGASMGGLIARYALCKMESDDEAHQTRLFFTIDTPHQGANIAPSVQTFVQLYHDHNPRTREAAAQMSSVAAQQMLLYWIPPRSQWRSGEPFPPASELRGKFVQELLSIGWFPKRVQRSVAVADGLGDGSGNGVPAGAKAFWFECTMFAWANLWATQAGSADIASLNRGVDQWSMRAGGQRIDGAPGGTRSSWEELYDGVDGMRREVWHRAHCFVSTPSACGIPGDPYTPVSQGVSPFNAIATSTTVNLAHVELTAELKNFLAFEIAGVAPAGPVIQRLPVYHPDCLRSGDEVCMAAPDDGQVFRRDPGQHDAMIARGTEVARDARLTVLFEGTSLCFRSQEPTSRLLGRVQRDGEPFEANKEQMSEWTRVAPVREEGRLIRLLADNGRHLTPVQRAMGKRLEALGQADQGVLVSRLEHALADGDLLALRADNGRFVSRMGVSWGRPIAATKGQPDMHCRFVVKLLGGSRLALRNEGTHYVKVLTRGGVTRLEAFTEQLDEYGHMVLVSLGDNRVALQCWGGGHAQRVDENDEIRPTGGVRDPRCAFEAVLLARG